MRTYETLTEALKDLKNRGYRHDFNLATDRVACKALGLQFGPGDFHVDEIYRFEGENDPDDSAVLFALTANSGVMGVMVDAYGAYANSLSKEMLAKLRIDEDTKP